MSNIYSTSRHLGAFEGLLNPPPPLFLPTGVVEVNSTSTAVVELVPPSAVLVTEPHMGFSTPVYSTGAIVPIPDDVGVQVVNEVT